MGKKTKKSFYLFIFLFIFLVVNISIHYNPYLQKTFLIHRVAQKCESLVKAIEKKHFHPQQRITPLFIYSMSIMEESLVKPDYLEKDEKNINLKSQTLPPPEGIIATGGRGVIELIWDKPYQDNIRGYHIYRSKNSGGPYKLISSEPKSVYRYFDLNVLQNEIYYYVIVSEDIYGNKSPYSSQAHARRNDEQPEKLKSIEPIKRLKARVDFEKILLNWEEIMDEVVVGYNIYRKVGDTSNEFKSLTGNTPLKWPFFEDNNVTDNKKYIYSVTPVDKFGNESSHHVQTGILYNSLYISDLYFSNPDKPLKKNEILNIVLMGTHCAKAYFEIEGLISNVPMDEIDHCSGTYRASYIIPTNIKVLNATVIGFLEDSNGKTTFMVAPKQLKIDNAPPPKPQKLRASFIPEGENILLSWEIPTYENNDIESFEILRGIYKPDSIIATGISSSAREYIDEMVTQGTKYIYQIVSIDNAGNKSDPSEIIEIFIPKDEIPPNISKMGITDNRGVWRVGETVSVFLIGEPDCEAEFSFGESTAKIPMIQINNKGRYEGRYILTSKDTGEQMVLKGKITDRSGNSSNYISGFRITVLAP